MMHVALRKELLEQWRTYRLLIVGTVLLCFAGFLSPLTARYAPEIIAQAVPNGDEIARLIPPPTAASAVEQYVKNVNQFGVLLALLMAMGAVAQEKDKGTAALMLVKPLSRGAFLGAKFVALVVTFAVSLALAGAACYYYTLVLFEALDVGKWLMLNGLLLVLLCTHLALTLFFSTLTSSQVVAGGLAFGAWMLLSVIGALPHVGDYVPGRLAAWANGLVQGGEPAWPALWTSLVLTGLALAGAKVILERQEL